MVGPTAFRGTLPHIKYVSIYVESANSCYKLLKTLVTFEQNIIITEERVLVGIEEESYDTQKKETKKMNWTSRPIGSDSFEGKWEREGKRKTKTDDS